MRTSSILLLVCFACVCIGDSLAEESDRGSSSRGLLKRGLLAKAKITITTKPPPAPAAEEDYAEEGEYEGGDWERGVADRGADEAADVTEAPPVTTTEGKRLGGVRPFRSNTELLEALKRKRAQQAQAKSGEQHSNPAALASQDETTEAPVKANFSKKRFSSGNRDQVTEEPAGAGAVGSPAPSKPSRNRFGRPSGKSLPAAEAEEETAAAPAGSRTGRNFSRRN